MTRKHRDSLSTGNKVSCRERTMMMCIREISDDDVIEGFYPENISARTSDDMVHGVRIRSLIGREFEGRGRSFA